MATFGNNAALGFKFITTATWNARNPKQLTSDELASGDIIFIQPLNQLYAGGIYIGITPDQATALSNLSTDVTALKEKVGTTAKLSSTLLAIANDLKGKLDGGSYDGNGTAGSNINKVNNTSYTNVVDALNALNTLVSGLTTGVASVNGKNGTVTLTGADIAVSTTNSTKIDVELGKKVAISTDTTVKTNTGKKASDYTDTKVIGDAIEAAHAAATSANTNAGNKIAKSPSDTTAKTISGAKGSTLTDAAAIATAIETACERLLKDSNQAQTNWGANEKKTLTTLRDLIKGLQDTVDTITTDDLATIQNSITAIKNELGGTEGGDTRNLVGSFLDAIATILPTKNKNNTYTFNIGTGTGATTATTIQGVINDLVSRITTAAGSGVTKITNGDGITVTNNGVGNVTVNANSGAKLTAALTTVTNGATTAKDATIQTALNDINAKAAKGIGDAATAKTAADNAQTDATAALKQLKWVVI